jgi:transposase
MKFQHIVGADISKKTIDFASHQLKLHLKINNDLTGFKNLIKWLNSQCIEISEVMIVMEHTGIYSYQMEQFLHTHQIRFTKVSALAIKRSMGLVRGKSDKQDAIRIARYGFEKAEQLTADKPLDSNLHRLKLLHTQREKLVRNRSACMSLIKEFQFAYQLKKSDVIIASQIAMVKTINQQIKKINDEMQTIIDADKAICDNYRLLQSIKGVGEKVAIATIIKTHNFTRFENARKFACFCGTAPFENSSGTSIRSKTRVSHLADKKMKTLLDLAAKSAIQHDKELRAYYLKRRTEGKSKMSTINVVRNKLLFRMFAVIKRGTPYKPVLTAA